jgi:hypothetical protein
MMLLSMYRKWECFMRKREVELILAGGRQKQWAANIKCCAKLPRLNFRGSPVPAGTIVDPVAKRSQQDE